MTKLTGILICVVFTFLSCKKDKLNTESKIKTVSAMKNVMMEGDLSGKIRLDSLKSDKHLFGLGPIADMKGEITIYKGKTYQSSYNDKDSLIVSKISPDVSAPFFVYAREKNLLTIDLPKNVNTLDDLEDWLKDKVKKGARAFAYHIDTKINHADIHIQNLPDSVKVRSPKDAHIGQFKTDLSSTAVKLVGFYSDSHQGVFTHHDTHLHVHLIDPKNQHTGHLDAIKMQEAKINMPGDVLKTGR